MTLLEIGAVVAGLALFLCVQVVKLARRRRRGSGS